MVTLREARESIRYSQEKMAVYMDISRPTYAAIEKDPARMTLRQLKRFCEIVGMNAADLFLSINSTNVE